MESVGMPPGARELRDRVVQPAAALQLYADKSGRLLFRHSTSGILMWVDAQNCCNLQVCLNFISSNKFFWWLLEIFNCKNESYTHFGVNVTAVILFVIASLNGNCGGIFESLSSPARKPCQPCKYYIRCSENITRIWNSKVQSITPTALQISLKPQV